ncbi:MAG TPA: potassium-transporting ATPase subunit KdpC [Steroidobacteraceae bacterium]|jgi:K+-transporting ATPase ATPase C chain|nr:potassium-transporting ATPase subunit KdpC [Steroidobacteraceae bacterium]
MQSLLRPVIVLFVLLTLATGFAYPLVMTGIGRALFPVQVSGSMVARGGVTVGSSLIGQPFADPGYFWGRLSATTPMPYNARASGGSNLGPSNPALIDAVRARIDALKAADTDNSLPIPVDLVTASASGLDPEISPAAALYQVARVARARQLDPAALRRKVLAHVEGPQWGLFGEARVNVLSLNLALDRPERAAPPNRAPVAERAQ